ncbi:lipopolysaccharide biosynthesis protein [Arthrobacter sp. 2MCAF15]|uniref:lipopolysaccharide biosynthesis protein n=1 Tax=Arthrobacter sp. 2MCAF15 TaxID=3232984 RepID=UPI003F915BE4
MRIAFFALGPLFSIIVPILTLPAISVNFGHNGWASIAVGQSLGVAAAIVIELGWTVAGPIQVARESIDGRSSAFRRSLLERGCVALLSLPAIGVVVHFINPVYGVEAFLTAIAMAMGGMSAAWFYVGTGASIRMLLLDSIPRVASSVAGAVLLISGAPLIALPLTQLTASFVLPFIPLLWLPKGAGRTEVRSVWKELAFTWRVQGAAFVTRVASSAYVALPTALMATVAPIVQVASYAAVDRVGRTALAALAPFNLALQGWVPAAVGRERRRRMVLALWMNAVLALISTFGFWLLAPSVIQLLFAGEVSPDGSAVFSFGLAIGAVVLSRCTGIQILAVLGRTWTTASSTIVGLVVSVPMVLVLGAEYGAVGVAWAIAVTEMAVLGFQVTALLKLAHSRRLIQPGHVDLHHNSRAEVSRDSR